MSRSQVGGRHPHRARRSCNLWRGGRVMVERTEWDRRRFLNTALSAAAAVGLPRASATYANQAHSLNPGASVSLGPLKQGDAGLLNVGYADVGPSSGQPVV